MADIFISYASADRERARLLADALTKRGYVVWWDRTIPPGRVFDEVIQEAIQGARCMVVLWSADSTRSNWVKTEAAEGVTRGILVPALIGDVAPPIEFKRIQSANLSQWSGDEAYTEYCNLLDAIERLMKQTPRAAGDAAATVQAPRPLTSGATSNVNTIKTFVLGALVALAVVGAFWLYGKGGKERLTSAPAAPSVSVQTPAPAANTASATVAPVTAPMPSTVKQPASTGRVNLLSPEQGGQVLVASTDRWKLLIDGKEDAYVWTDTGFGVFGFRDGKSALIDTFTVLVPAQSANNIKEFELFAGNAGPTGPFESIGRFSTQNMRMMQNPYQEFRFPPVKAKYLKFQSLRAHDDSTTMFTYKVQLFGVLQ